MRTLLVAASCILIFASGEARPVTRREALAVLARPGNAQARVGALVNFLHGELPWVATDYKSRTVEEVLARGMGNCADHAAVLDSLLKEGGFQARWVQEINLQAPSETRRDSAVAKVAERGNRYSVFGFRHNDHRWLEVWDPEAGSWFPADSAIGVVGMDGWVSLRLGFEARPEAVQAMIAPVFVEAACSGKAVEARSEAYLVQAFGQAYRGRLKTLPGWPAWVQAVRDLEPSASAAFKGTADLHQQVALLDTLAKAYAELRMQYAEPVRR